LYLLELTREELQNPTLTKSEFYLRPARETELDAAIEIDDDACTLYTEMGLSFEHEDDDPFFKMESERWAEALRKKRMLMACNNEGERVGFVVFDIVEGRPFVEQISVRRAWMKRGVGRALVERAKRWSVREGELWLTTYGDSVPWNKPWYERLGFVEVTDADCGPEINAILAAERAALPTSERRLAMVYRHERKGR
jgi:predicted N-acetyltransferase YhbS